MFKARAVRKTSLQGVFKPAGFEVWVSVDPVTMNVMPQSMMMMKKHVDLDRCDTFVLVLGTEEKVIIME
jgi:hypothetical protein